MPRQSKPIQLRILDFTQTEVWKNLLQHLPVKYIELRVWNAARTDFFHARLILLSPRVGEGSPIQRIPERVQDGFCFACYSRPPIDERAEDVKK